MAGPVKVALLVNLPVSTLNLPFLTCFCNQTEKTIANFSISCAQFHQGFLNGSSPYFTPKGLNVHNRKGSCCTLLVVSKLHLTILGTWDLFCQIRKGKVQQMESKSISLFCNNRNESGSPVLIGMYQFNLAKDLKEHKKSFPLNLIIYH